MFQSASLPVSLSKADFKKLEPALRGDLLAAQLEMIASRAFSMVIVIAGVDGAGKNDAIARLHEWMDVRHLVCNAYGPPTRVERHRPEMWRYWRDLPARGKTSIVVSSWYNDPLRDRVLGKTGEAEFEQRLSQINRFEALLAHEKTLVLKFWFALGAKAQKKRLEPLRSGKARARRILTEWADIDHSPDAQAVFQLAAMTTSTASAPWMVIPSEDPDARDLALGRSVQLAVSHRLAVEPGEPVAIPAAVARVERRSAVESIDLGKRLSKDRYDEELLHWQKKLTHLVDRKAARKLPLIVVFEGNDAAGKGGAIRRLTRPMDPRRYRVHRIAAPSEEELAHPYLWRFWRNVPRKGQTAIFDRSWYGRVLVERVEGFCSEADWARAYNEINEFEAEMGSSGGLVVKFWLAISKEEQLARFKAREETPYKQFKITDDDWRNRLKWDAYAMAAGDMIDRTSTAGAPWHLVSAEDKRHARVTVLKTLCKRLKAAL
ncbi:polyphosphate:AMP phosphotransferase [Stappia sp. ES.058]|uniref:polyphosphate:AMP phosphotransferase n=1 Tax=Stappia sp. ES.058 TaxID=1881061 RepID=UPI00087D9E91|nr:polyphosphate:AMP phosphotransferase [Stappia sp. ES.058]SDU44081.1 polyphosphate:AMP phosphotransferase [Stappia sp. ES.058]